MKKIQLLSCLVFSALVFFTSCTKEEAALERATDITEVSKDITAIDANAIAIDLNNLPEGFEVIEENLAEGASNRSCCEIYDLSFIGNTKLSVWGNVEPYRGIYWQIFKYGVQVDSYSWYNNTPFCKAPKFLYLHGQKCAGLSARAVMGVGYNLCAEEYAYCN